MPAGTPFISWLSILSAALGACLKLSGWLLIIAVAVGMMLVVVTVGRTTVKLTAAISRVLAAGDGVVAVVLLAASTARWLAMSAAMGSLMIVMPTTFELVPGTPFRQSLASMTTDPSMQVIVPVAIATAVPRDWSVAALVIRLPVFAVINDDLELATSDEIVFSKPSSVEIGPGMQKYPSLQFAHAHP
jgi:hypothetical protein